MGEFLDLSTDVDRAFHSPYSEENRQTKEQAQHELQDQYPEQLGRPYLDEDGNVRNPETNEVIVEKYAEQQRDSRTNRVAGTDGLDQYFAERRDRFNVRTRTSETPYDHMDYDNMTPVQLAKCEALARNDGQTTKADALRQIRHERLDEKLQSDREKRPDSFDSPAYSSVFSREAYIEMSDRLVDGYARRHKAPARVEEATPQVDSEPAAASEASPEGSAEAAASAEPVAAEESRVSEQAGVEESRAAAASSTSDESVARVQDAEREADEERAEAAEERYGEDEVHEERVAAAGATSDARVASDEGVVERGSGRVRRDRDPDGPGFIGSAGTGAVAGAVAADREGVSRRERVVEDDSVTDDRPRLLGGRRTGVPVAGAVGADRDRVHRERVVEEDDTRERRAPFWRRRGAAGGIGALAVGGGSDSGGFRERFSSWREDRRERRGGIGRALLVGALAIAFTWLALDEISEHSVKVHGDKITFVDKGDKNPSVSVKEPKIKVKKPDVDLPKVKKPDVDLPKVTVTPDSDGSTNDTDSNQTGGTEYQPGTSSDTNTANETPAQERAEERHEERLEHKVEVLREKLARERQENRAHAASLAARTIRLRPGGTIWGNVKRYETNHNYPHDRTAVRGVTQSVLNRKGISWGDARHLPVGYSFTIPASSLQHLR